MNYREFYKSIESEDIRPVYIFTGEEVWLHDKALDFLIGKLLTPQEATINHTNLDGRTADLEDLKSSCETLPFLAARRATVLKNPEMLVDRLNDPEDLLEYIRQLGDHQVLVISDRDNKVKKNTRLYRNLNKQGNAVLFDKIKGKELTDWVLRELEINGKTMDYGDMNYFIQQSGYLSRNIDMSLYELQNEIKKLSDYSAGDKIQRTTLDQVLIKPLDKNIFDFLGAVGNSDVDKAMAVFNEIYLMNEPVPKILFMISRQFRLLLGYVVYRDKGYNPSAIQEKLGIKPYEFGKIAEQAKGSNERELRRMLEEILHTDKRLKTVSTDQKLEMEMLIVKLTGNYIKK